MKRYFAGSGACLFLALIGSALQCSSPDRDFEKATDSGTSDSSSGGTGGSRDAQVSDAAGGSDASDASDAGDGSSDAQPDAPEPDCAGDMKSCAADGVTPRSCQDGVWVEEEPCADATPVCLQATGECGTCTQGDVQCGDETTPQSCDAQGAWVDQTACSGGRVCFEGECADCDPSGTRTRRCSNGVPQTCSAAGQWQDQPACADPTPTCNTNTNTCTCTEGATRCLSSTTPERCDANGNWVAQAACAGDTPACVGAGQCACATGTKECVSSVQARSCNGNVWVTQNCNGATPVCFGGECKQCSPGALACSADRLQRLSCSASGTWDTTNCPFGCANAECLPAGSVTRANVVTCDTTGTGTTCGTASPCCYNSTTGVGQCRAPDLCEQSGTVNQIICDGPNDCGAGQLCCYVQSSSGPFTECFTGTACGPRQQAYAVQLCDPGVPSSCPAGQQCNAVPFRETYMFRCE